LERKKRYTTPLSKIERQRSSNNSFSERVSSRDLLLEPKWLRREANE